MKNIKKYVGLLAGTLAVTTVVYGGRGGKSEGKSSQETEKHIEKGPRLSETNSHQAIANSRFGVTPASFVPSATQLKFDLSQLEGKPYAMLPRLLETNASQQTRTNNMSAFRPVPKFLYTIISTNNQTPPTPSSTKFELKKTITVHTTNMQTGIRHSTKPQNTLRTTQSNTLQSHSFCLSKERSESLESSGRSFLEKAGFTISEICSSSPLELVKEYVIEYDLKVNLDRLEAFYWKCFGSIRFFTKASKTLRRPIIYFSDSVVMLFEDGMEKERHPQNQNIIPFITSHNS